jgi:hypothetical protein
MRPHDQVRSRLPGGQRRPSGSRLRSCWPPAPTHLTNQTGDGRPSVVEVDDSEETEAPHGVRKVVSRHLRAVAA